MLARKRTWATAGLAIAVAVLLAGHAPAAAPLQPGSPRGTLTVAVTTDVGAIEVPQAPERNAANVAWTMFDSLVYQAPDGSIEPALAEKWDVARDDITYTFYLRRGVTFHNGEPFNADSVVYTWQTYSQRGVRYANFFTSVQSVEKIDTYTVKITTKAPDALLLPYMALGWTMIPPKYHAQVGAKEFAQHPVGTGPFVFKEWVKGDHVTVTANPNWWRKGYPLIQTVVFKPIPESSTRVAALRRGEIDTATRLTAEEAQSLLGAAGVKRLRYLVDRVYYVAFNNVSTGRETPAKDVKVRLAMNYAVDRQSIMKSIFGGYGQLASGFVGPADLGYDNFQPFPYDLPRAKQLLAEAGYPNGFSIGMACPSGAFSHINEVCEAIVGYLGNVGIRVDLQLMESNAFWDRQSKKQLPPLFVDSWSSAYREAFNRLQGTLIKDATYAQWYDPKFETLTNQIGATVDRNKRAALYKQMHQLMVDDPPFVYLYYPETFEATRSRVVGYQPRAAEEYYLWGVSLSDAK